MKCWIPGVSAALMLVGLPTVASADLALPPPPLNKAAQSVKLVVVVDGSVKEPRLEIPSSMLIAPRKPRGDAGPQVPLIVVGVALAAGFVSGGLWLSRRGRNVAILAITLAFFGLGSGVLVANIGPPPRPKPPVELTLPADITVQAKITLQVVDKGDAVRLIVPFATKPRPEAKPGE